VIHYGEKLNKLWGVPAIIDNRPGGTEPSRPRRRDRADGYTVLFTVVTLIQAPVLPASPHDLDRDFVPVTLVTYAPVILAAEPTRLSHAA
jgi:tripartite-type tricarboxylate transporter receptor subunit TctC